MLTINHKKNYCDRFNKLIIGILFIPNITLELEFSHIGPEML
jgi:hypothetical protein